MAKSLTKSSASLVAAGGNLAEAAALTATANAIIQDADSVGTALKTTSLRLRGTSVKVLEEEGLDTDGAVESTSKLRSQVLATSGVDILTDTGAYKSTYQILLEIAEVWDQITDDKARAGLLELLAGKRNSSVIAALLQNPEDLKAAYEDAMNAEGSALKENERYLDSIQGKIDQFNNAMQSMWSNTLDSDWVKGFVEFGTELIKIVDDVGMLNTALVGLGMYLSTKYMKLDFSHPIKSFKQMFGKPAITSVQDMQTNLEKLQQTYDEAFAKWKADPTQETRQGLINAKANLQEYKNELETTVKATSELETAQKNLAHAQSNLDNYKGTDPKQLYKYQNAVDRAKQKVDAINASQQQTTKTGATGWQKLGVEVDGFAKKVQSAIASMLVMYAISKVMQIVGDLWDKAHETAEEAKKSFEELSSELSKTEAELSTLESQLEDIKSQIEDINKNTPLTFTDQEELSRLKAQSAELQRQIDLANTLKEHQQYGVNESAINAANKYEQTGVKTGKTTKENIVDKGNDAGLIGAGIGSVALAGVGTTLATSALTAIGAGAAAGTWAGPIGMVIGAAIGAIVAGVGGAIYGAVESANDETIGESIDNMRERYAELQEEFNVAREKYQNDPSKNNKKKFEEAQEALRSYQSSMAGYISEMDSYYSQIKANWETATTEQKKEYIEWADQMDTWAIRSGGANAKSNALDRIFGENAEGNFAKARDEIDRIKEKLKEAQATGDELAIADALAELENFKLDGILLDEDIERLRNMGIYLYEAEDRFKDVVKTESEFIDSDLEDVAKDINKITDGLGSLKSAFEEVIEKGALTAKTVMELKEALKIGDGDDTEELTDAWREYLDVMMSGVATTEEMIETTEMLATEILNDALKNNDLTPENKQKYVVQLEMLGVTNAEEYLDDLLQKNMSVDLEKKVSDAYTDALKQAFEKETNYQIPEEKFDEIFNNLTADQLTELADEYDVVGKIASDTITEIAEKYNVEEEAVQKIIDKLNEKQRLENDIAAIKQGQSDYNDWYNSFNPVEQDLNATKKKHPMYEQAKQTKAALDNYSKILDDFWAKKVSAEDALAARNSLDFYNADKDQYEFNGEYFLTEVDLSSYLENMIYAAEQEIATLQAEYDNLWREGENKGYIIDGKIVNPDFQAEIDNLQAEIDGITTEIDEELTVDIQLKIALQDKSKLVDEIQSVFDTLQNAVNEYNEEQGFSIDTFQTLLELGPEYLSLLYEENGQLNLNKEAIEEVARARMRDLAIQKIQNEIQKATNAVINGNTESLDQLIGSLEKTSDLSIDTGILMDGLVNALDASDLSDDIKEKYIEYFTDWIEEVKSIYEKTKFKSPEVEEIKEVDFSSISSAYETLKESADQYNKTGYLTLDNLQAFLSLEPEYIAALEMENGQLSVNQATLIAAANAKLEEAKATATQSAIAQLNALAERKQATEISNSALAANQATIELGRYSGSLSTVASQAIVAAGAVASFNAALNGAQNNPLVSDEEVQQVLDNYQKQIDMIGSVQTNLPSHFDAIVAPSSSDSGEEEEDDPFKREMEYWENRIGANQAKYEQLQNEIDLLEAKGMKANASYYEEQIKLENERRRLLEQQKDAAKSFLNTFAEGSEEWWEVANTLNDIEAELDDVTASIIDLQDAIGEINAYKFDEFNKRLDDLTSKLETIRDLIAPDGEEDWFDDDGSWTEAGVAVLGSYLQELETYKEGYKNTVDELNKYAASFEGNESYYETLGIHSEQEYYDKTEELINQQYDYAESISDTEQSVVDMYESNIDAVEEYTETLIDSYNDYIDSVKEALDAERDLYDFKKKVQNESKNISELERKIASLSGSTNAADIASRRKLEAELYSARESLNDTYYEHAKTSQEEALNSEAEAYETAMTNMIDGLRTSLEEATANMDEFLMGVTSMVMYNADTVLAKYEATNLPLTKELTSPWEEAKKATSSYSGNAIDLMNQWTKEGGFFAQFNSTGTTNLKSPWSAGTTAANSFKTSVSTVMSGVVSNIATNVRTASGELSKLYQQIQDTEKRASNANVIVSGSGSDGYVAPQKKYYVTAYLDLGSRSLSVTKSDSNAAAAMSAAKIAIAGEYEKVKGNGIAAESAWQRTWRNKVKYTTQYYANGTTGTKRDEWAITDEFGPELKMYATPDGNLSFMALGSTVVPHDLTMDLIELPDVVDSLINMPKFDSGINMVSNAVNKPEINLSFEALVKAERIDENTLPEVKKYVQQEINSLVKQMNYAIKGKGGR